MQTQFLPLIPVYKQLLTSCMKLIQVSDNTDNYLALLLMACKAFSQKTDVQPNQLTVHVVETGVVSDLLRLLFSMLEGPVVNCSQRDQIAALLLQMPCQLSDLIKQDALTNLTKPLLLAFRSSNQDIVSLAFQVMELWTDSLTPQFLDAKMTVRNLLSLLPSAFSACMSSLEMDAIVATMQPATVADHRSCSVISC